MRVWPLTSRVPLVPRPLAAFALVLPAWVPGTLVPAFVAAATEVDDEDVELLGRGGGESSRRKRARGLLNSFLAAVRWALGAW